MTDSTKLIQVVRRSMDVLAHRTMRDWNQYVKATGISMPQFGILMQLQYHGLSGITDISARMDISAAAASQLVDKLFQSGLIERAEDPKDRRAKQITLSEKGKQLIKAGMAERYRWVDALVENLSPTEREKIGEAFVTLTEALQRIDPQTVNVE